MRIALGSDHAGYLLKESLRRHLLTDGHDVVDVGTHDDRPADYPDIAAAASRLVASGSCSRGILVCGTGIGMAMAANKVCGIRAASVGDLESARLCREHNDANILAVGARIIDETLALQIARVFIATAFAGDRHQRRVDKIMALESIPAAPPGLRAAELT